MENLSWASVIVIGPGLGLSQTAQELLEMVINKAKVPVIIDADGITLLSKILDNRNMVLESQTTETRLKFLAELLQEQTVLTPHLKELSRLLGISVSEISNKLIDTARQCSYNNNLVYAIKDARTIVSQNQDRYVNVSGNNGMATGGSGDVLTGIIAALIAQGLLPFDATCLAVYIHGLAGDIAAKEKGAYSMMASDIINSIEKVLNNIE
jgi:NAD(P)H-hydrate epimerase